MRASYRKAIEWIALNDEPGEMNVEITSEMISVGLIADLFGKTQQEVARQVVKRRKFWASQQRVHAVDQLFKNKETL